MRDQTLLRRKKSSECRFNYEAFVESIRYNNELLASDILRFLIIVQRNVMKSA